MRRAVIFSLVVMTPLLLFLAILMASLGQLDPPPLTAQAGRRVWQAQGCMECHTIFGNGGYTAKEITTVYAERGPEWLASFLERPPMLTPRLRHPRVTGDQQGWLLAFLSYLDTIRMTNWPPHPSQPSPSPEGRVP